MTPRACAPGPSAHRLAGHAQDVVQRIAVAVQVQHRRQAAGAAALSPARGTLTAQQAAEQAAQTATATAPQRAGERVTGDSPFVNDNRLYLVTMNPTVPAAAETAPTSIAGWRIASRNAARPECSAAAIRSSSSTHAAEGASGQTSFSEG